jgi:hypothetical protein
LAGSGLLGTVSKSLVLHDVFVSEHRSAMVSDPFAGTRWVPWFIPTIRCYARRAGIKQESDCD